MLKTYIDSYRLTGSAYHLGEGRVLKTKMEDKRIGLRAYHLGEGRVLKTLI